MTTISLAAAVGPHRAPIDLDAVTAELEREGVQPFRGSYHQLLDCIDGKLGALASAGGPQEA